MTTYTAATECRSNYYTDTGRRQERGDREIRCGLPPHGSGDHTELDHEGEAIVTWPPREPAAYEPVPAFGALITAQRDELRDEVERLRAERDAALFDRDEERVDAEGARRMLRRVLANEAAMRPVVEAAEALVSYWKRTHQQPMNPLIAAVDAYRSATTDAPKKGGTHE